MKIMHHWGNNGEQGVPTSVYVESAVWWASGYFASF